MQKEYKNMSDIELDGVLRQFIKDIEGIEQQIIKTLPSLKGIERTEEISRIKTNYARIKSELTDIEHYTQKSRNSNDANSYYTHYFKWACTRAVCEIKTRRKQPEDILKSVHCTKDRLLDYLISSTGKI